MTSKVGVNAPIRTLFMVHQLRAGGSERQMTEVARSLDRQRFTPAVAVMRPGGMRGADLAAASVPVEEFPVYSFMKQATLRSAWQLRGYLRRQQIGLFHSFDTPGNAFGVPVARWAGVPVVLSSQRAHRELSPPGQLRLLRITDRIVDGVVVNCDFLRRHLVKDEGVPESKIRVCYNGIDLAAFHPGIVPAEKRAAGELTVGVICALRPEKDLGTLMEGFARARAVHPHLRLLFVGDGPEEGPLRQQAERLGIAEYCRFAGAQAQVGPWMKMIDIFVLPSRSEAFSNSLMEAMACGCAAIASDIGGNPELVKQDETGLLFRQGDADELAAAIGRLANNEVLRKYVIEGGTRLIPERFSLKASVARMTAIYEEFLELGGQQ